MAIAPRPFGADLAGCALRQLAVPAPRVLAILVGVGRKLDGFDTGIRFSTHAARQQTDEVAGAPISILSVV